MDLKSEGLCDSFQLRGDRMIIIKDGLVSAFYKASIDGETVVIVDDNETETESYFPPVRPNLTHPFKDEITLMSWNIMDARDEEGYLREMIGKRDIVALLETHNGLMVWSWTTCSSWKSQENGCLPGAELPVGFAVYITKEILQLFSFFSQLNFVRSNFR